MKTFAQKSKFLLDTNIFPLCNGLLSHDTWSRYVTIVTWLLSQITWVRDTKFRGALLPGPGMPHCSEKTLEMNEFSENSSNLFLQFVIFKFKELLHCKWPTPTHSGWHSSGRAAPNIKLNGVHILFPQWKPWVSSLLAEFVTALTIWQPSSCQAAHSFQSDWQIWVKFLGKIPPPRLKSNWRRDLLLVKILTFLAVPAITHKLASSTIFCRPLSLKLQCRQEIRNCSNELCVAAYKSLLSVWFPYFHSNSFTSGQ